MNSVETKPLFNSDSLSDWLTHLEQLHNTEIDLGLARITKVGEVLDLINFGAKVITVAGTNGKGTTCAYLEQILIDAGYKVGVFSSPHIARYNERLRINKQELADAHHCQAFAVIEKARADISLSYFEFSTLACLYLLQQEQCDFILLEVGLGGRLDATNMVEPDISVITTIGIDHVDWLGDNREDIGFEKAGIFRAHKPAICGDLDTPSSVLKHAQAIDANLQLAGRDFKQSELDNNHWQWQGAQSIGPIKQTLMPVQNASTALAVIEALQLNIKKSQLISSIEQAQLAGRLQFMSGYPCDLYLDVAHNPQSAAYLASQVKRLRNNKGEDCNVHAVVAMLSDKDMKGTLSEINAQISSYAFASLDCFRGATAQQLFDAFSQSKANKQSVSCFENVTDALDKVIKNAQSSDIILVFGSFFTVSEILNNQQG